MKSITVEVSCKADTLADIAHAIGAQSADVRAMTGCAHYAVYTNADKGTLAIVQRWQDMPAFETYRQSPAFAALLEALRPNMSAPPVTTIAEVG